MKTLALRSWKTKGCLLSPILFDIILQTLASTVKEEKGRKNI